ncbi:MAG: hypothetical protein WCW16_04690 [Candidatus Magasanikbacteria bacterium]
MSENKNILGDLQHIREIANFRREQGHLPTHIRRSKEEMHQVNRIGKIRRRFKDGTLPDIVQKRVEGVGVRLEPGREREENIRDRVKAYKLFVKKTGRKPSELSDDPNERKLSDFIRRLRLGYRNEQRQDAGEDIVGCAKLPEDRKDVVLKAGIILEPSKERERLFEEDLQAVVDWRVEHKKLPSQYSSHKREKYLASRLRVWRCSYANMKVLDSGEVPSSHNRLSPDKMKLLEDNGLIVKKEKDFYNKADEVLGFLKIHGRLPSSNWKNVYGRERQLGQQISRWRLGYLEEVRRLSGNPMKTRRRLMTNHLKFLVEKGVLSDDFHLIELLSNRRMVRPISERDSMICFPKKTEMSTHQCGKDYMNANALMSKDDVCFGCRQGGAIRDGIASSQEFTRGKRTKLGIIDK